MDPIPDLDVARLIQLAVAPVFLLTGVAAMLNVLTGRVARIVDRARPMEAMLEAATDEKQMHELNGRLRVMSRRARYVNAALTLTAFSGFLVAIVVLMLFLHVLARINFSTAIAVTFITAILCLAVAMLIFLVEVRIATVTVRIGPKRG